MSIKKIVIVGGGFAGINIIKQLRNHSEFDITLVDINNYLFFPPLIYQVATGFMEPSAISYPFRKLIRNSHNIHFRLGKLEKILPSSNRIILDNGSLEYDILIIATGTETNYFGMTDVAENAIAMKTISDAITMRNILLKNMELASRTSDTQERKKLLTTVLVGAGPTGVELSGIFAEMRKNIIHKDYPEFKMEDLGEVILIDAMPSVLAPMSSSSQKYTFDKLTEMGVKILLNTQVKGYKDDTILLADGSTIISKNVIWSAGVVAKSFEGLQSEDYGRGRRLKVNAYNRLISYENIFALGDACIMDADEHFKNGHPQMAQPAIQQAVNLAKNLKHNNLKNWVPFKYKDKGAMAIIGSHKAVADIPSPKLHLKGFSAWFIWVFIHILSLVTYKNRLRALYNWMGAYMSKDQAFRMIFEHKSAR